MPDVGPSSDSADVDMKADTQDPVTQDAKAIWSPTNVVGLTDQSPEFIIRCAGSIRAMASDVLEWLCQGNIPEVTFCQTRRSSCAVEMTTLEQSGKKSVIMMMSITHVDCVVRPRTHANECIKIVTSVITVSSFPRFPRSHIKFIYRMKWKSAHSV